MKVNCATITEKNAEIHFFGAIKNNENSSKKAKIGLLEKASDGTLFLDQVDKLPLNAQSFLQETLQQNKQNIRMIASTH